MSLRAESEGARPNILDFPCDVVRLSDGNTLITDAGDERGFGSKVIEVDPGGQVVWSFNDGLRFAHSAKRLPDGNTLISDTTNNRVIEVTREGQIVFDTDHWGDGAGRLSDGSHLDYPNDAHLLASGRLLITDRNNDRCVITDRAGTVEWGYSNGIHHPHNCKQLSDGSVIVADSDGDRVLIVDRDGSVLWSFKGDGDLSLYWPRDAHRLQDGDVLVTDSKNGRLLRVSPDGDLLWEYRAEHFAMYYTASLLENGNVLASDQFHRQIVEIDPFGNIIWTFRNYRTPYPIHQRLLNGSFHSIADDGQPDHWMVFRKLSEGRGELSWRAENGRRYPGLVSRGNGVIGLFQVVGMRPGIRYQLAAEISTDGVDNDGAAFLSVGFMDEMNGYLADVVDAPKGTLLSGTNDWVQERVDLVAPTAARSAEIRFLLKGSGSAWIRNILLFS